MSQWVTRCLCLVHRYTGNRVNTGFLSFTWFTRASLSLGHKTLHNGPDEMNTCLEISRLLMIPPFSCWCRVTLILCLMHLSCTLALLLSSLSLSPSCIIHLLYHLLAIHIDSLHPVLHAAPPDSSADKESERETRPLEREEKVHSVDHLQSVTFTSSELSRRQSTVTCQLLWVMWWISRRERERERETKYSREDFVRVNVNSELLASQKLRTHTAQHLQTGCDTRCANYYVTA